MPEALDICSDIISGLSQLSSDGGINAKYRDWSLKPANTRSLPAHVDRTSSLRR